LRVIDQLVYKIIGDTKGFDKSLSGSDKKMDGFGAKAQNISKVLKGVMAASFVVAAKKVVDFGISLGNMASDAAEVQNKFSVVFSSIMDNADAAAKNLSDNYGLSNVASQDLLSGTGDLLTGFGFSQAAALDLSEQVNTLAVDLASFTNFSGGAEGASMALTKALLGERESVKSLGISIMEADIKQLAEDKGIVGEIDRQTKAMLTLEIALSQSKNAVGDFARSQEEYANQKRIFDSAIDDLKVKLGQGLLPIMASVVGTGIEMVDFLVNGKQPARELAEATDDLATVSTEYRDITNQLREPIDNLTQAEKDNLVVKQALLKFDMQKQLTETNRAWDYNNSLIEKNSDKIAKAMVKQAPYAETFATLAFHMEMTNDQLFMYLESGKELPKNVAEQMSHVNNLVAELEI
jgi:hypothetical protein